MKLIPVACVIFSMALAACGGGSAALPSTGSETASTSAGTARSDEPSLESVGLKAVATFSPGPVSCPERAAPPDQVGWHRSAFEVLASPQLTYSSGDIAAIASYLREIHGSSATAGPPPTLREVKGALVNGRSDEPDWSDPLTGLSFCILPIQLTNTGTTPVQIQAAGLRLATVPEMNTYQYRLVDLCTVNPDLCPRGAGAGPGHCNVYSANARLSSGAAKSIFEGTPAASAYYDDNGNLQTCPPMTIGPAQTLELEIDVWSAQPLTYSIEPVLTVATANGTRTVDAKSLASSVAFATADQFSCYSLSGTTFSRTDQGTAALKVDSGHWCV